MPVRYQSVAEVEKIDSDPEPLVDSSDREPESEQDVGESLLDCSDNGSGSEQDVGESDARARYMIEPNCCQCRFVGNADCQRFHPHACISPGQGREAQTGEVNMLELPESDEVLAPEAGEPELYTIEVAADLGCADHVADKLSAPNHTLAESRMSQAGLAFLAADGGEIPNEGEMTLNMISDVKAPVRSTFQAAKVTRPLMSISKVCDNDNIVLVTKTEGIVRNSKGVTIAKFPRQRGLYVGRFQLRNPTYKSNRSSTAPFQGPGK